MPGRVAIVTGAARNIGAAIAQQLARDGLAVAVNYLGADHADAAQRTAAQIVAAGGRAHPFEADVCDEHAVEAMVAAVARRLGPPTVLVNNAAAAVYQHWRPWHEIEGAEWDSILRTNVTGAFLCARAVYPHMQRAGGGAIVSMSSVMAVLGSPGRLHYVTSKGALISFSRALAREIGDDNIRVNAIIVGAIETPDEHLATDDPPEVLAERMALLQSLRRRGLPTDVAGVTAFLVSESAEFITGQCITVDGGWVMH